MALLLSRTAERLFWGARYVERAEDTARIVRAYNDLVVDYPSEELFRWEPLAGITGSELDIEIPRDDLSGETSVLRHLLSDRKNPSSIASSVASARENLRTTREVLPREAWQAINQLFQYVTATAPVAVDRQLRDRFLLRVVEFSRRLDGVLESTMSRTSAYRMLRLGRQIERADMTTRVVGVAAAGLLHLEQAAEDAPVIADEVRWMHVLRSVSALQMYQRSVKGPIDGHGVVRFLISDDEFPRSVASCFAEIRDIVLRLPQPESILDEVDRAMAKLDNIPIDATEGERLDQAMDAVQRSISRISEVAYDTYISSTLD